MERETSERRTEEREREREREKAARADRDSREERTAWQTVKKGAKGKEEEASRNKDAVVAKNSGLLDDD